MEKLFTPYTLGKIDLANRIVMSPMTRSRAINNIPNDLMKEYYAQRSTAGLIITEGTSPSPNGLGYARIPGLFNIEQARAFENITRAVHKKGSKIFVQLMHTGRVSHPLNMPRGSRILAPSSIAAVGMMYTDELGLQPQPVPVEMTIQDIKTAIEEYAISAELAIKSGFDGVELHGANGYLIEQFLNPNSNHRKDEYGGSPQNRMKFLLELVSTVATRIGAFRVGIRLSPYGAFGDMTPEYEGVDEFYATISSELSKLGILYIHLVDHSSMGSPLVSPKVKGLIRKNFRGSIILSGGYDRERANVDLLEERGDLIAFGRPFISNPNFPEKLLKNEVMVEADPNTFYTPGEKGYTDYK